ncbi:MAG: hypothetical protein KKI14_03060, partial [Nanoarchaeota archaeon]|nr:hypothetical protein [Nanoarchaeota archaeon]
KTIPPETVNKEAILTIKEYPDKRIIIHYLQPHDPFIGENYRKYITKEYSENEVIIKNDKRNKLGNAIKKIVGIQIMWKLGKIFNSETLSPVTLIGMNEGVTGIRKAYEENLNLVLEYVSKLLPMLDGNVLIIGDHGEYLGEHGIYAHATNKRTKEIWEVPYMIIKKEDQ